jgi:[citrate (pro-3S)-lyase] ligase
MLLDSDFSGYSDPQNIDIQTRENGNEIFKLKYPHCVFNHDPIYNYDSNVDIFAKILQERVDAFRQALTKNRPILFIHFSDVPLPREALECFKVFLDRNGLQHKLLIIVSDQKNYSLARDGDIFTVYSKLNTKLQTINGKDIAWHQSERRWSPERFEAEREIAEAIVTIISEHFPEKTAGEIIRLEDASEAERKKLVHEVAAEYNVKEYLKELKAKAGLSEADGASRKVGAVVMNCNPFTLGHRHLIERAAAEVDRLIVFVVEEDLSYFKFADRFNLVCESTADLKNVMVVRSGKFIISTVTLPGYFTRDNPDLSKFDASVDLDFFGEYIAPALGVTVRFAGEEPLDKVTKQYNDAMCLMLPRYGVEFAIIPRLESEGEAISASRVRTLLETYDFDAIEKLVPKTTLRYLQEKFMTESPLHSSIGKNPAQ